MAEAGSDRQVFLDVHSQLPREGPGNRASTTRALEAAQPLPLGARVLDIGCGPGMQTLDLAELMPGAVIRAVDLRPANVTEAASRVRAAGLGERVTVEVADMQALPYPARTFDLIWCEGAAYVMGVADALESWRPLLAPDGRLAFTDLVWLTDAVPPELKRWWASAYPDMGSIARGLERARLAGYRILDHFVLPEAAWWDDYYGPMERRIEQLRPRYRDDKAANAVLEACQREIDYYRKWSAHYGYLFIVAAVDEGSVA